eukprot:EG_transcript_10965
MVAGAAVGAVLGLMVPSWSTAHSATSSLVSTPVPTAAVTSQLVTAGLTPAPHPRFNVILTPPAPKSIHPRAESTNGQQGLANPATATRSWALAGLAALGGVAAAVWRRRAVGVTKGQWQWQALTVSAAADDAVNVSANVSDDIAPVQDVLREAEPRLCCPTCLRPLTGSVCRPCSLEYEDLGSFLDLTPASGRPIQAAQNANPNPKTSPLMDLPFVKDALPVIEQLERTIPAVGGLPRLSRVIKGEYLGDRPSWGKSTFESPIVAGVYERGWRQTFARAGFPGPEEEFQKAMDWLRPVAKGKVILDLSCGSGLFTRRFVASGEFAKVFALDYSENMLRQTRQGFDADAELSRKAAAADLELVRADVARLPFPSDSLPAIHAGAAIHCWPSPTLAMTEVTRVLAPGGRAVLSTFLVPGQDIPLLNEGLREVLIAPSVGGRGMKYWEESELRDLCARVGLVNFEAERKRD